MSLVCTLWIWPSFCTWINHFCMLALKMKAPKWWQSKINKIEWRLSFVCSSVCLYLTASSYCSWPEAPLGFLFQDRQLGPGRGPQIILQLSVVGDDVWFQSTMFDDACVWHNVLQRDFASSPRAYGCSFSPCTRQSGLICCLSTDMLV